MTSQCKASDSYGMIFEGFAFLSLGFAVNFFTQLVANLLSTIASLVIIPNALEEQYNEKIYTYYDVKFFYKFNNYL